MNKSSQEACAGPKQDLLRQIAEYYPVINLNALELITQIKTVAKLHTSLVSQGLAKYGLTEARMYLLCSLFLHEKSGEAPMSPSVISDKLEITRATVTSLLDGLQESGFITRQNSGTDRRAILVNVTDKSRTLIDGLMSQGMPKLASALAFIGNDEMHAMVQSLAQIAINLEESES
jgi:DNA-binding MarR family transcriptional regulator